MTVLYDRGLPTLSDLANDTAFTTTDAKSGLTVETYANDALSGTPKVAVLSHVNSRGVTITDIMADPDLMASILTDPAAEPKKASHRWTGTFTAATEATTSSRLKAQAKAPAIASRSTASESWTTGTSRAPFQPSLTLHLAAGPHKVVLEDKQGGWFGSHVALAIAPAATIVSPRAAEMAAKADAVVVCAGYDHASEGEAGDRTFALPFGQDQLIAAMAAANPKTIVSITSGGNVDSNAWLDKVPALLETWYAGQEGGTALAEILFGDINPSGHLPATFERHIEDNPTPQATIPKATPFTSPTRKVSLSGIGAISRPTSSRSSPSATASRTRPSPSRIWPSHPPHPEKTRWSPSPST